jgi:hypothetical protein
VASFTLRLFYDPRKRGGCVSLEASLDTVEKKKIPEFQCSKDLYNNTSNREY